LGRPGTAEPARGVTAAARSGELCRRSRRTKKKGSAKLGKNIRPVEGQTWESGGEKKPVKGDR